MRGLIAKAVNKNLASCVIHGGNQIWIDDRIIDHKARVIFIGWIRRRGILGFDKIDRCDGRIAKIVKDGDRGRVCITLGVVRVKYIAIFKLGLACDHGRAGGHVHAQLDVGCRIRIARGHRQLQGHRAFKVFRGNRAIGVDGEGQQILP